MLLTLRTGWQLAFQLLFLLFVSTVNSQTTVFNDNFSASAGQFYTTANGQTGNSATWDQWRSGVDFGAGIANGRLSLINDATGAANNSGWILAYTTMSGFSAPFSPTLSSNPGIVTWSFNMRQLRTDPNGFANGGYGLAFILAGAWGSTTTVGSGYAVVLGSSSNSDPISLVRYTAGLRTSTTMIQSNTTGLADFGNQHLSVRVTYNPANNQWQLFVRNDGASFVDPNTGTLTLQGSATNTGSVGNELQIMGALWNAGTVTAQTAFIDNVRVAVAMPVINTLSPGSKAANSGAFALTVNGTNFRQGSIVRWNGVARTTAFVSATQLTASIPAGDIATQGTASVTVQNGTGISNAKAFSIDAANVPSLAVSPDGLNHLSTIVGSPSTSLTYSISGSNLSDNATVTAPANFAVSLNGTTFTQSVIISRNTSTLKLTNDPVTVHVRLSGTAIGVYSGNIVNSTPGGISKTVSVSGTVGPPEPTVQSSAVTFANISSTSVRANFVSGNGTNRLVVVRSGAAVNAAPTDNISYDALPLFGSGSELGTNNFVVYSGAANSVVINALSPTTIYHIAVYEYNGSGGTENYRTTTPAVGNFTTLNDPLGWPIETIDTVNTIDFDSTVDGVNTDSFQGAGFSPIAGIGELSSNTFAITGFSSGNLAFGGSSVEDTGYDYGIAESNVTEGGIYAFETSPGNMSFGIQPAAGEFAPGTVTVKFQNRTGSTLTSLNLGYSILIYNDQNASSNFNFSHSANNSTYTVVPGLDVISPATADGNPTWASNFRAITITGLSVPNGGYYYLRWSGATVSGSGSFDEFAIDDISLIANPTANRAVAFEGVASSIVLMGNAKVSSPLTINGTTTFNGGKLSLNGNLLTLNGPVVNTTTAGIKGGAASSLAIGGSTNRSLSFDLTSLGTTNFIQNLEIKTTGNNTTTILNPIVIGSSLVTDVNQVLNLGTNALTGSFSTITNNGTIRTQNTGALAIPSARNWNGIGTINYDGAAAQTIVPGVYENLTISATAGGVASGNLTVNQVLYLPNANASATMGSLHMGAHVLTLGPNATNTGTGEVTGIMTRNSFVPLHVYTYGHPNNSIMFQDIGTLPTSVSLRVTIGTAPSWKPGGLKRENDLIQTGAVNTKAVIKTNYLDSELNGNNEAKLVHWNYITASPPPVEQGRSNYNATENWITLTNANIGLYFTSNWGTVFTGLGESTLAASVWNGSQSSSWTTAANWTPVGMPTGDTAVLIPNTSSINIPVLNPLGAVGSLTIEQGGILNAPAGSDLTVNKGNGAWINYGTFNAAPTSSVNFTNADATIAGTTTFGNITIDTNAALRPLSQSVMRIAGNFINNGMFFSGALPNTVEYIGNSQTVTVPNSPANAYYNLVIGGTGAVIPPLLQVRNTLTLNQPVNFAGSSVVMTGDENGFISGTVAPLFDNLIINKSAANVSLNVDAEITGTLTLEAGNLILGTRSMTLGQNPVVGPFSTSNMVVADAAGQLKRRFQALGTYLFPIGEMTSIPQYAPIEVGISAGSLSNAVVGASVVDAKHPNNASSTNHITRYWNLSQSGISSGVANVTAVYTAGDVIGEQSEISAAHLSGVFNQQTNPWVLYAPLDNSTLTATGVPLNTANSVFTGVRGQDLSVMISGFGSICQGSAVALTSAPTGGDGPFTYSWSAELGSAATASPPTTIPGSETYTLTIRDANGIIATDSATVIVDVPTVAGMLQSQAICSGTMPNDIVLSGHTGEVLYWEIADNSNFEESTIMTNMLSTLAGASVGNIAETKYVRAAVRSGSCTIENSSTAILTVENTTWNGNSWSNGVPGTAVSATFAANYTASGNFEACSITITNNAVVVVPSGFVVTLSGAVVAQPGTSFTVESNANLIQSGAANNNVGSITVKRASALLYRLDYTMWSSPTSDTTAVAGGQTLQDFSPVTSSNRFFTYNTANDQFATISRTEQFKAGMGYLIRIRNNHPGFVNNSIPGTSWTGTFYGVPFSGDLSVDLNLSGQRFNMIGNPYPSSISADAFLDANPNIEGTLYFWRRRNNDTPETEATTAYYATYTSAGGVGVNFDENDPLAEGVKPTGYIQVGQGFLVQALSTVTGPQAIAFNNTMRSADDVAPFFRSSVVEKSRIWLNVSDSNKTYNQTLVAYMDNGLNELDRADGKYINDGTVALTSNINNTEYVIQARAAFAPEDVVPMYFKTPVAGSYTISIDHVDGLFEGAQAIYLKDNTTQSMHNLKHGAYTFSTAAGIFGNRFELVYQTALGIENGVNAENQIVIYQKEGKITINSGKLEMATIKIYDMRGRLIISRRDINASEAVIGDALANQVLIVEIITTDNIRITRKIVN